MQEQMQENFKIPEAVRKRLHGSEQYTTYDPVKNWQLKADTINHTPGELTGFDCPHCLNRGYFAKEDSGRLVSYDCACAVTRRCLANMERSGLRDVIRRYTFDSYTVSEDWQSSAKQLAEDFAKAKSGWFFIGGQSGAGKTHLCTAICREFLLAGVKVHYMPWREDTAQIKAAAMDAEKRLPMLEKLKKADVLYIDDLFKVGSFDKCKPSTADQGLLFEILNARYTAGLRTIISSEYRLNELLEFDEAYGRIVECAEGFILNIGRTPKRNYRTRNL